MASALRGGEGGGEGVGGGEGHARATGVEAAAAEWEAAGGERQAGSGGQTGSAFSSLPAVLPCLRAIRRLTDSSRKHSW